MTIFNILAKKQMVDVARFADGKDTEFAPVIQSLRTFLGSIQEIHESKGGAIIFFTKLDRKKLYVKIFPFLKNVDFFELHFLLSEEQNEMIRCINQEQPYRDIWHYELFLNENQTDRHLFKKVPPENVVHFSADGVSVGKHLRSWRRFATDVIQGQIDRNSYEQLYFAPDCTEIAFVPLPVLSTPSILLVLDASVLRQRQEPLLRALYFRSRDTISKYLYTRLIDNVTEYLKASGDAIAEEDLINRFIQELCKVLLPISYTINDGAEIAYYSGWPKVDDSQYLLELLEGKYQICFKLTSFYFVNFEPGSPDWKFFHHTDLYQANKNQSSILIARIFNLLYTHWRLLKSADERAQAKLAEKIQSKEIKDFIKTAEKIKVLFSEIKIEAPPAHHVFLVDEKEITLVVNKVKLLDGKDISGPNQLYGFKYLQQVLKTAAKARGQAQLTPEWLIEEVGQPRTEKKFAVASDADGTVQKEGNTVRTQAEAVYADKRIAVEDLYSDFFALQNKFFDEWEQDVEKVKKDWGEERLTALAQVPLAGDILRVYKYQRYLSAQSRLHIPPAKKPHWEEVSARRKTVAELAEILLNIDEKGVTAMIEAVDMTAYSQEVKKTGRHEQSATNTVLECYKAMKKILNKLADSEKGSVEGRWFYTNLVEGGYLRHETDQPPSRHSYRYDESKVNLPIEFVFASSAGRAQTVVE